MTTELNPLFDLYRSNWLFGLHLTRVMQENRQRLRQFQAQTAEHAVAATGKLSTAVTEAQDWASLSQLSTKLIQQQAELAAGFWQDFFALAATNRIAMLDGVREAVEDLQARNTEAFQAGSGNGTLQPNPMFEAFFKPFEPFMQAAAAGNPHVNRHPRAKPGPNHA